MSSAPPARTLMPIYYLGSSAPSQETGTSTVLCVLPVTVCSQYQTFSSVLQVPTDHARIIRKRDFGVLQIRMPDLFPLEAVITRVSNAAQSLDLPLDRHIALPREHIVPVSSRWDGILQMRVPDPGSQLLHGVLRCFVRGGKGMVRIPEQCGMG